MLAMYISTNHRYVETSEVNVWLGLETKTTWSRFGAKTYLLYMAANLVWVATKTAEKNCDAS